MSHAGEAAGRMQAAVAIAAAGTGGHIYPGLAVAAAIRRREPALRIFFLTTRRGLGPSVFEQLGYPYETTAGDPAPLRLSAGTFHFALELARGAAEARRHLKRLGARAVLATGGYGCAPGVLAAKSLGLPVVWQEQNALPGRATRLLGRLASQVALGYPEAAKHLPRGLRRRSVVTGNPIREEILTARRDKAAALLGLDRHCRVVLLVGASQGARRLNEAVIESMDRLSALPQVQVLVSTGRAQFDGVLRALAARYPSGQATPQAFRFGGVRVVPYLDDMPSALALSDLAISRAGAISIAEFTARGVPMVLVPYPHAAEGHQDHNARAVETAGAGVVLKDRELTGERLFAVISELLGDTGRLSRMAQASRRLAKPRASEDVAGLVLQAGGLV